MKVKTSELSGAALDWAVAVCEGRITNATNVSVFLRHRKRGSYRYSTNFEQGGRISERERISSHIKHDGYWVACIYDINDEARHLALSHSRLEALMRCYVLSKMGDTVDVPEELL